MGQLHQSVTDFMFYLHGNIVTIHFKEERLTNYQRYTVQGLVRGSLLMIVLSQCTPRRVCNLEILGYFCHYIYNYLYYYQARFRHKIHFQSV